MKVLADIHHDRLYESLCILFEDRLGWELYRPIGVEWFHEDIFNLNNLEPTAEQYVSPRLTVEWNQRTDPDLDLGIWWNEVRQEDAPLRVVDHNYGREHRGISLDLAKRTEWDVILSSVPGHFSRYERFRQEHAPNAKHVFQMGNMWNPPRGAQNILNSTTMGCGNVHSVHYHQEFSREEFFHEKCENPKSVLSMMHYHLPEFLRIWDQLRELLPDWKFSNHGAGNPDGVVRHEDIPRVIREHGFMWHNKRGGEGYGYNIHHAAACGRILVCDFSLYSGMQASHMLVPNRTGIDIHGISAERIAELLRLSFEKFDEMSEATARNFNEHVDFDAEFERIQQFLCNLK